MDLKFIDKLSAFKIEKYVKRIDGDWEIRYTWKATKNGKEIESPWIGYKTIEEAIEDLRSR